MAEEAKTAQQARPCARLDAAYEKMKAEQNQANYIGMFEALEADLKDEACAFLRLDTPEAVEELQKKGTIKWSALKTDRGQMLTLFTTAKQATLKPAPATVGLSLLAFFKVLTENKDVAGFVVNPLDEKHGFLLDRNNLEIVLRRAKGVKVEARPIEAALVQEAVDKLFTCAVGVPAKVTAIEPELAVLGGADAVMRPIQKKWQKAIESGSYKPATPVDYVKTIVKDAMTTAFVSGALVRKGADMVRDADPTACIDRVPYLKEDLVQNTDEYLVVLSDILRAKQGLTDENVLWVSLANGIGLVAYGAMRFGFGWGLAKCCESEGPSALREIAARAKETLAPA